MGNTVKTEIYRGYTIHVVEVKKKDPKYDVNANNAANNQLVSLGKFSIEEAIGHMKRNIDYWEGIEGLEEKTNRELANYLVEDHFRNMSPRTQDRFLLEVADRLRGLEEKGPTDQVVPVNALDINED